MMMMWKVTASVATDEVCALLTSLCFSSKTDIHISQKKKKKKLLKKFGHLGSRDCALLIDSYFIVHDDMFDVHDAMYIHSYDTEYKIMDNGNIFFLFHLPNRTTLYYY